MVVHELAHIEHLNHSAAVWQLVHGGDTAEDYSVDQARSWLRRYGDLIQFVTGQFS